MPQTKQKPAAATQAQPIQAEPSKPTPKELRRAETKRQFQALNHLAKTFWEDMGLYNFQALTTFKLILDRNRGSNTPVENFLVTLIHVYESRDDDGKGLTLQDIQWQMEQDLTDHEALSGAIRDAHFMASCYPLPESSALAPENS
jgi:hypothetical protein